MLFSSGKVLAAAAAEVRARTRRRECKPLLAGIAAGLDRARARELSAVASRLESILGVSVDLLRPDEKLRDLLEVSRRDLPVEVAALFDRVGLGKVVYPFAIQLLDLVEERLIQHPSRVQEALLLPTPQTEDEWVERLLELTVEEFLSTFA